MLIFHNADKDLFYISSADWMGRNLDRRIEVAVPIYDADIQQEIRDCIAIQLADNVKARVINEDQDNMYVATDAKYPVRSQFELHEYYRRKIFN